MRHSQNTGADTAAVVRAAIPVGFVWKKPVGQNAGLRRRSPFTSTSARRGAAVTESDFDSSDRIRHGGHVSSEIIFEVTEAEEGGYCATALGHGITTQAETVEELRAMVRDAVSCFFDDPEKAPKLIRLHFVRDEVLAR